MLLYNIRSNRQLREGDVVRVRVGPRTGKLGKVVGVHMLSDRPLVIQYPRSHNGVLHESFAANDLELPQARYGEGILDPMPSLSTLTEGDTLPSCRTCGVMLCLRLDESDSVYTFVPSDLETDLRSLYDSKLHEGKAAALKAVAEKAYVTRLPHLVELGFTEKLNVLCESDPVALAERLTL